MTTTSRRRFLGALAAGTALTATALTGTALATSSRPEAARARHASPRAGRPLYLGTYTSAGGKGVGLATYDGAGQITQQGVLAVDNPSFLALHPSGTTLYTVDEQTDGGVSAIALDAEGGPRVLGTVSSGGAGPTHLSVHPDGDWLLSANYNSGSVAVHPIAADGSLGERTDLVAHDSPPPGPGQDGPHAHQIVTSPDGGHVLAVDLGNDTVYTYELDAGAGKLTQVSYAALPAGAGPRHLAFHPGGAYAYVACELNNTVVVCGYDPASGELTPGQPQSTGTGEGTSYPGEVVVTSDGGYVFVSNRGHDSISRYAVADGGASLRLLDTVPVGGAYPRHLALSPDDALLFASNQNSGTVTVFHLDAATGDLTSAGDPFAWPSAVCALPL